MKKKEYKLLLENWKSFLKEEDKKLASGEEFIEKFILNGILKLREEIISTYSQNLRSHIKKTLKIIVSIKKISSFDYLLRVYFLLNNKDKNIDVENRSLDDIANIEFQKINKISQMNYTLHHDNKEEFETINKKEGFTVIHSYVKHNLGPLIYDIVLEFVSKQNCVLCSDRAEVSNSAQKVWDNYLKRIDVKNIQLDNVDVENDEKSTPEFVKDDITQISAVNNVGVDNWKESSLSKGFYKESYLVINYLLNNENFIVDIPGFEK